MTDKSDNSNDTSSQISLREPPIGMRETKIAQMQFPQTKTPIGKRPRPNETCSSERGTMQWRHKGVKNKRTNIKCLQKPENYTIKVTNDMIKVICSIRINKCSIGGRIFHAPNSNWFIHRPPKSFHTKQAPEGCTCHGSIRPTTNLPAVP